MSLNPESFFSRLPGGVPVSSLTDTLSLLSLAPMSIGWALKFEQFKDKITSTALMLWRCQCEHGTTYSPISSSQTRPVLWVCCHSSFLSVQGKQTVLLSERTLQLERPCSRETRQESVGCTVLFETRTRSYFLCVCVCVCVCVCGLTLSIWMSMTLSMYFFLSYLSLMKISADWSVSGRWKHSGKKAS